MNATVRVLAQYHENYNTETPHPPYWKPKGGVEFEVEVNADVLLYCDNLVEILTTMVNEESNPMAKYTYVSHEVNFSKPETLSTERFMELNSEYYNN